MMDIYQGLSIKRKILRAGKMCCSIKGNENMYRKKNDELLVIK